MYTDNITVQFSSDNELLTISSAGRTYSPSFKSNKTGYLLACILNTNFDRAANTVTEYGGENGTELNFDGSYIPANTETVFQVLVTISEAFYLYHPLEWFEISHTFRSGTGAAATNIKRLRDYLDLCNKNHIPYTGDFYTFLCNNYYFGHSHAVSEEDIIADSIMFEDETGELIPDLETLYRLFSEESNLPPSKTYRINCAERFIQVALASLQEIANSGKTVRKCENCGRYFIPENRSDTLYCDNPSPQVPTMTCKEYGSQRLWYARQKDDELATLSRNILSAKSMLAKRNPDIQEYNLSYDYFRNERKNWKKAVEDGSRTREEYRKWLLLMQSQKVIKEANSSNDGE